MPSWPTEKKLAVPIINEMDFLRACALRLDGGETAETVMVDLRARYTTLGCVNVKACLVRRMCTPPREHTEACERMVAGDERLREWFDGKTFCDGVDARVWGALPPSRAENVRRFTVSRDELKQCKRASAQRAIVKNKYAERVGGRKLLAHARDVVDATCAGTHTHVIELALALMVLTGRRECEILNGRSTVSVHTRYSLSFGGQAKKRGRGTTYVVPVLYDASCIVAALERLRDLQHRATLTNRATSLRYQSHLSRYLASHAPWCDCKRVHSLRGIYTRMATRLFDWRDHSEAFVAMCILGHSGITESLVYTPFHLGPEFVHEPSLGDGHLTEWSPPAPPQAEGVEETLSSLDLECCAAAPRRPSEVPATRGSHPRR